MKILAVEDDASTRRGVAAFLEAEGHRVTVAGDGQEGLECCRREEFELVVSDMRLPRLGGLALLRALRGEGRSMPVIIMTAFATVEDAVQAMREGATDYLTKPLNLDELALRVERIAQNQGLKRENEELRGRIERLEFPEMIGTARPLREIQRTIQRLSLDSGVPVVIYGESGTGKELVARAIHNRSARKGKPFVAVNCAAFPEELIESEFFGHRRGAFTGADSHREGLFQAAHQGTLFLDEAGEMSPRLQGKLLRALQEKQIQPLGASAPVAVDVRIICATSRDLSQLVQSGTFREDLYYRLNVVEILVPPLRARTDDISLLANHFLERFARSGSPRLRFSTDALDLLRNYGWPGNVRELENLVRRLLITSEGDEIQPVHLPASIRQAVQRHDPEWAKVTALDYKSALDRTVSTFELEYLRYHLRANQGNITRTAGSIGLSRVALHRKIATLGITLPEE